jgi:hypothetical protein
MEPLKSPFTLSRGGFVKINLSGRKANVSAFQAKRFGVWCETPRRFKKTIRRFLKSSDSFQNPLFFLPEVLKFATSPHTAIW